MHPAGAATGLGWLPPSGEVAGARWGGFWMQGVATGRRGRRVDLRRFIFPATVGRSGMRCPQILWISLCKLAELLRYVFAGKEIVSVGDIFEHVQNSTITDLLLSPAVLRVHQLHHTFHDAYVSS